MRPVISNQPQPETRRGGLTHRPSSLASRPAFSLVELMIAIMILGIGMTMVATVFPVGLNITRGLIQQELSQSATDQAIETLRLKVPRSKKVETSTPGTFFYTALFPDTNLIELTHNDVPGTPPDIFLSNVKDSNYLEFAAPSPLAPVPTPLTQGWDLSSYTTPLLSVCRIYTEQTGWDAERVPPAQIYQDEGVTFVVPSENLPAKLPGNGYAGLDMSYYRTPLPAAIWDKLSRPNVMSRLSLADVVYPPIQAYRFDKTANDWIRRDSNSNTANDRTAFFRELAERRYSWTAIHQFDTSSGNSSKDFYTNVVVTYRGDADTRFAQQRAPEYATSGAMKMVFDIYNANINSSDPVVKATINPWPDADPDTDTLFPQPWLVLLSNINPAVGEVRCFSDVARLLPVGSYFIIAKDYYDVPGHKNLRAGAAMQVLACEYDPTKLRNETSPVETNLNSPSARLQVERGWGLTQDNVFVWVFPPPITRGATGVTFGPRCPIAQRPQRPRINIQ